MNDTASAIRSSGRSRSAGPRAGPQPILLWQLRGATDDRRGLAIETAFGDAFGLELDAELVLLHLQSSLDALVAYADRIEAALPAQGWRLVGTQRKGSVHD